MKQQTPIQVDVGTTMCYVREHFYYVKNKAAPIKEYCVCSGEVKGYCFGKHTEIKIVGKNPDGFPTPSYFRTNEIGQKVFYTEVEATALAKEMTEKYERSWGWLGEPDIPMRRTWSQYLNPPQQHKNITSGRKSQALGGL